MAKLFLIIICVCTSCVHLAWAQMNRKDFGQSHKWNELDLPSKHGYDTRHQGQSQSAYINSNLKSGNNDHIQNNLQLESDTIDTIENERFQRNKRHAVHNHGHDHTHDDNHIEINQNTDIFIKKLFKQFSNSDTMNLVEFESMIKALQLDRLIVDNQLNSVEKNGNTFNPSHDDHSNETVRNHVFFLSF